MEREKLMVYSKWIALITIQHADGGRGICICTLERLRIRIASWKSNIGEHRYNRAGITDIGGDGPITSQ